MNFYYISGPHSQWFLAFAVMDVKNHSCAGEELLVQWSQGIMCLQHAWK